MKKYMTFLMTAVLALSLTACGGAAADTNTGTGPESAELAVFAAASLQESLDAVIADYEAANEGVTIRPTYDSSGTLKTQIENGAACDVFLSASPKQLDQLDELGLVDGSTRTDLLENKVVLAAPEGNPAGVESFDQLAERLRSGEVILAIGNSDVPVGQYTQKIFDYYGIDEAAVVSELTYGSNAKEVTTQVAESIVDCGIIYGTDAFSAGLTAVDSATAEMCGRVVYPAAVLKSSAKSEAAGAFLAYLGTEEAAARFEAVGFSPIK